MFRVCLRIRCSRSETIGSCPIYRSRMQAASLRISSTGVATSRRMRLGAGIGRGHLLHGQQLERVERDGHLAREEFEELQVVLVESARLGAFDVERSQDFVVQDQRHGERAAGTRQRPADTADRSSCLRTSSSCRSPRRNRSRRSLAGRPAGCADAAPGSIPTSSSGSNCLFDLSSRRISTVSNRSRSCV